MLPTVPFIVLDQNAFRPDRGLLDDAIRMAVDTGAKLLVIEAAMVEMLKNAQWEETARRSLAGLEQHSKLVALGRAVPELMRREFAGGRPGYYELEDLERTPSLQALIRELPNGRGRVLDTIRATILQAQATVVHPQYLDHAGNKAKLIRYRDTWAELLNAEARSITRRDRSARAMLLAHPVWGEVVERELVEAGLDAGTVRRLSYDRSVTSHSLMTRSALALRWLLDGGLDTAAPEKVTNDVMDAEYVTVASFCLELVTLEGKVKELLSVLREAAELRAGIKHDVDARSAGSSQPTVLPR